MKKIVLFIFLVSGFTTMAQEKTITQNIDIHDFISNPVYHSSQAVDRLVLHNSRWVIASPFSDNPLPEGGEDFAFPTWFSESYKNAREIHLVGLYLEDLSDDFTSLTSLNRMKLCFKKGFDLKHVIDVLSKVKSLKYLDISGSTISKADIKTLKRKLRDVEVFDIFNM